MLIFHKIKANNRINFHIPLLDETSTVFLDMKANMPHDFTHEIESNCDNKQISRSQRLMPVFFCAIWQQVAITKHIVRLLIFAL